MKHNLMRAKNTSLAHDQVLLGSTTSLDSTGEAQVHTLHYARYPHKTIKQDGTGNSVTTIFEDRPSTQPQVLTSMLRVFEEFKQ